MSKYLNKFVDINKNNSLNYKKFYDILKDYYSLYNNKNERKCIKKSKKKKIENFDSMEKLLYDLTNGKYAAQKYYVYTIDGYRLNIYRIVHTKDLLQNKKNKENEEKREVFCMMHGLFESSINFICKGYNSLAFEIFINNYDVWLCNNRGNNFSKFVGKNIAINKLMKKYSLEDLKDLGFDFCNIENLNEININKKKYFNGLKYLKSNIYNENGLENDNLRNKYFSDDNLINEMKYLFNIKWKNKVNKNLNNKNIKKYKNLENNINNDNKNVIYKHINKNTNKKNIVYNVSCIKNFFFFFFINNLKKIFKWNRYDNVTVDMKIGTKCKNINNIKMKKVPNILNKDKINIHNKADKDNNDKCCHFNYILKNKIFDQPLDSNKSYYSSIEEKEYQNHIESLKKKKKSDVININKNNINEKYNTCSHFYSKDSFNVNINANQNYLLYDKNHNFNHDDKKLNINSKSNLQLNSKLNFRINEKNENSDFHFNKKITENSNLNLKKDFNKNLGFDSNNNINDNSNFDLDMDSDSDSDSDLDSDSDPDLDNEYKFNLSEEEKKGEMNWTFEDMSTKDLSSIIKYIKKKTKKEKIIYVGFSQGSIQLLISSCLNDFVSNSIKRCYLLSLPIILRNKYELLNSMKLLLLLSRYSEFLLKGKSLLQKILPDKLNEYLITNTAHILTHKYLKYYNENIKKEDQKKYFYNTPNGTTSNANLKKWLTCFNNNPVTNIIEKKYMKCSFPMTLIYGNKDTIVDTENSIKYMNKFFKKNLNIIINNKWSHLDPLWSDNNKIVISFILKDLNKNKL